jgi:Putative transposase/Transposase zinc-binding domain
MLELADIFRRYGPEYRAQFQNRMPPSHLRAMRDIEACRTKVLGGQVYLCEPCQQLQYSYHSCKNRHCPKCQNGEADLWLEQQRQFLLPVPYFLVTFTLPEELHPLARSQQKVLYGILFQASAAALQKLALDPRLVGGQIGMMGVLQTWARDLSYHPHIHYVAAGGGLSRDHHQWLPAGERFFVPVEALSLIFRAKFRDALKKAGLFESVSPQVWEKDWVVHCEPVGNGEQALKYLAPYVYRIALSNNRLVSLENGQVTFRYKEADGGPWRTMTLPALEFIRRFLQHVLPQGFVKVRYYGFLSSSQRHTLETIREVLEVDPTLEAGPELPADQAAPENAPPKLEHPRCPRCGGVMRLLGSLSPAQRAPP